LAAAADTGVAVEVIGDRTLRSERRVLYGLWWQLCWIKSGLNRTKKNTDLGANDAPAE